MILFRTRLTRAFKGILVGTIPLCVTWLMSPLYRSPYLLAYPAVIFSAWQWGAEGSIAAAAISGVFIEYFVFRTKALPLAPTPDAWAFRETLFLLGSVLAGLLTRIAAKRQEQQTRLAFEGKLALLDAEKQLLIVKNKAAEFEQLSLVDPLTGMPNRRSAVERLQTEIKRCWRQNDWLSVLLIDVDYFKNVNDTMGHTYGDECLRRIAGLLAAVNRESDLAARYGGEEFVVVLPSTDEVGARVVSSRIHAAIAEAHIPSNGSVFGYLTVSIGMACVLPTQLLAPQVLIDAADEALYRAKNAGRNQTKTALSMQ